MQNSITTKMDVICDLSEISHVRESVKEFLGDVFSSVDLNRVLLAVDEALTNIIEHANLPDKTDTFTLEMQKKDGCFIFILEDNAEVFDPTQLPVPDLNEHAQSGKDGGLGVFLYTTLMEAKHEALGERGNRLTLSKRYE